jgi:hypothetical protein
MNAQTVCVTQPSAEAWITSLICRQKNGRKHMRTADMSDRELLEAAAKAAEFEFLVVDGSPRIRERWEWAWSWWNPLTDDGDALRLAARLKLNIAQGDFSVCVNDEADIDEAELVRNEDERLAVLRRAIVRAAAAMNHKE